MVLGKLGLIFAKRLGLEASIALNPYGGLTDQVGRQEKTLTSYLLSKGFKNVGGVDGTRTRDPRRDRPVF